MKHLSDIYIRRGLKSWRVDLPSIVCIRYWLPTPILLDTCRRRLAGLSQRASRKTRSGAPAKSLQLAGNMSQFEFFPFPISDLLTFLGGRTSLSAKYGSLFPFSWNKRYLDKRIIWFQCCFWGEPEYLLLKLHSGVCNFITHQNSPWKA